MEFISETIYGLKCEYGDCISIINIGKSGIDRKTGKQEVCESSFQISLAIELPISLRQAFLKSVGIHKIGYLESGEQEFLIDTSDIEGEITLESFIVTNNRRLKVKNIEPYAGLLIVICKAIKQGLTHEFNLSDKLPLGESIS